MLLIKHITQTGCGACQCSFLYAMFGVTYIDFSFSITFRNLHNKNVVSFTNSSPISFIVIHLSGRG
jgi:hypothetical protein